MRTRTATRQDTKAIEALHRIVARISQGIAQTEPKLTRDYFAHLFDTVSKQGLMLVAVTEAGQLISGIHASKSRLNIFEHNLMGLTIAVHPDHQDRGVGKRLFQAFFDEMNYHFLEVRQVEMESRASNSTSIGLYRSVGFVEEGSMKNKTRNADGTFEDSLLMAWYKPESTDK